MSSVSVTSLPGSGAVRELADLILEAQGRSGAAEVRDAQAPPPLVPDAR